MSTTLTPQESALLPLIENWIAEQSDSLINELATWIAIPSVSRADLAQPGAPFGSVCAHVLDTALTLAEQAGFRTERHEGYAGSVIYGEHDEDIGLISHLDVVPAGEHWTHPPFALTRHGDFLIGRGVADNKGPAILNLYLLKLVRALNLPLHHNLRIVYGLAEETDMADLVWFAQHGPVPRLSLVTDGKFPVNYAQKGQITFRLHIADAGVLANLTAGNAANSIPATAYLTLPNAPRDLTVDGLRGLGAGRITLRPTEHGLTIQAQGIAGHAAFPEGTLSAAIVLLDALRELDVLPERERTLATQLQQIFTSPHGEGIGLAQEDAPSGKLTLNAGLWQFTTPGSLPLLADIRYPVTLEGNTIITTLRDGLATLTNDITLVDGWRDVPPFYLPQEDSTRQILQQSWHDVTGRTEPAYSMGGVTHSKVLPRATTFGPGYLRTEANSPDFLPIGHGLPHGADEVIHLPSLLAALPVYVITLIRLDAALHAQNQEKPSHAR
ncbi:Sapep family Mn(2+)-dependent dipeptidase [Pectobacterium brasiliense]|uniref:Sapep family Mn(2+)-dependent dipeptidase n=1 Tax=Pectobacterium brasiliense TaxID=180957 RepID=UPI001968C10B|nr:Sapep family Mn(2+)-dependent dipeptidase [Pectobacterium brasiliense]MBN3264624.1 Sapep family Mn(2+)-dependent dipeptidase [Pectobacterium brasiliense]